MYVLSIAVYICAGGLYSVFFPDLSDKFLEVLRNNDLENVFSPQGSNIFLASGFKIP